MRRYGAWAGNPRGYREDPKKCIAEVASGFLFYQCSRKRGHGPREEFCKQHAKLVEAGSFIYVPKEDEE